MEDKISPTTTTAAATGNFNQQHSVDTATGSSTSRRNSSTKNILDQEENCVNDLHNGSYLSTRSNDDTDSRMVLGKIPSRRLSNQVPSDLVPNSSSSLDPSPSCLCSSTASSAFPSPSSSSLPVSSFSPSSYSPPSSLVFCRRIFVTLYFVLSVLICLSTALLLQLLFALVFAPTCAVCPAVREFVLGSILRFFCNTASVWTNPFWRLSIVRRPFGGPPLPPYIPTAPEGGETDLSSATTNTVSPIASSLSHASTSSSLLLNTPALTSLSASSCSSGSPSDLPRLLLPSPSTCSSSSSSSPCGSSLYKYPASSGLFSLFSYWPTSTILMSNHLSAADPWFLSASIFPWEFKFVFKHGIQYIPIAGWTIKLAGDVPIHFTRDKGGWGTKPGAVKQMMNRCADLLSLGIGTAVFPEGTRSRSGRLQPFKDGFFRFCVERGAPILPCVLHNQQSVWPLRTQLLDAGQVYCAFGDPIYPQGKEVVELKRETRHAMIELLKLCPSFDMKATPPFPETAQIKSRGQGL